MRNRKPSPVKNTTKSIKQKVAAPRKSAKTRSGVVRTVKKRDGNTPVKIY